MQSLFKNKAVTCIIPFYNENPKVISRILYTLLNTLEIENIVVVDDGSRSRETFDILFKIFSEKYGVKMIRLEKNHGKSFAILIGLESAFTDSILLLDADLKNVQERQIRYAIKKFKILDAEMIILRRLNSIPFIKSMRLDTLLSGERIIKRCHLKKILKSGVKGYELEVAINQYFIDKNLQYACFWSKSSALNNYKHNKNGLLRGIFKDVKMYVNIIRYIGIKKFKNQISEFCKQEV
jgi:glycosyltransferase involved in cell wall biosynthesis